MKNMFVKIALQYTSRSGRSIETRVNIHKRSILNIEIITNIENNHLFEYRILHSDLKVKDSINWNIVRYENPLKTIFLIHMTKSISQTLA